MTKLHATLVFTALLSSSFVLANTDFGANKLDRNTEINQSAVLVEPQQQLEELDVQSHGGFTESDFFEY